MAAGVGGARVAVLFSGGLDSMVVAALAHEALPLDEPVDLVNVCFDSPGHHSPDRLAAWAGLEELHRCCMGREWRLVCVDVAPAEVEAHRSRIEHLMQVREGGDGHGWNEAPCLHQRSPNRPFPSGGDLLSSPMTAMRHPHGP